MACPLICRPFLTHILLWISERLACSGKTIWNKNLQTFGEYSAIQFNVRRCTSLYKSILFYTYFLPGSEEWKGNTASLLNRYHTFISEHISDNESDQSKWSN